MMSLKYFLYIIPSFFVLLSCSEQEPSIYGRYQVNRIEDGVIDTSRSWFWQIDSNYIAQYYEDSTLGGAQVYYITNDTLVFGEAYELEQTGEIEFDTTQWFWTFTTGANGIDTIENGAGKHVLKKIGPPEGPYYDTTEIETAGKIREVLTGTWAAYTNPLGKEHNEKFSYIHYKFKGNRLTTTHFSGNENLDPTVLNYKYFITSADEIITIPEKFYFNGAAWIKGNSHYHENKYKYDITDSVLFVQFNKKGEGIELIKE